MRAAPLLVASCALLVFAPCAGAVRYASPTGTSSENCQTPATACDLKTAIHGTGANNPVSGEEVIVEPGAYTISVTLTPGAHKMFIHGAFGSPRPVLSAKVTVFEIGEATTLDYVEVVEQSGSSALFTREATIERVLVQGTPTSGLLCQCYEGAIDDSVFVALPGSSSGAIGLTSNGGTSREALRNDTIYSQAEEAPAIELDEQKSTGSLLYEAFNTIAVNAAGGKDLEVSSFATLKLSHSDYATTSGPGTVSDLGGHVTVAPKLVNPAKLEFAELAGSPTIDAGLTEAANGALDFAGDTRALGASTDIGAYEFVPPSPPSPAPSSSNSSGSSSSSGSGSTGNGAAGGPPVTLKLTLGSLKLAVDPKTGHATLHASCRAPAGRRCSVSANVYAAAALIAAHGKGHPRPKRIGTLSGAIAAGASGSLTLKLSPAAVRALRRHHAFAATFNGASGDGTESASLRGTLRLRLKPPRR
jgi:hypothetical protein